MPTSPDTWLVTGATGLLGHDMVDVLRARGLSVRAASRDQLDITDPAHVAAALEGVGTVVNCAAFTDVDRAETDAAAATRVNAEGVRVVAAACADAGVRLVHISTDYVFSGDASTPYGEDEPVAPASAYGRSKAEGERAVTESGAHAWVVRTAWLYGAHGPCFPTAIARAGAERGEVSVVDDQHGQPTWARDVADFAFRLVDADAPPGIYHGTASGQATWFDFAREVTTAAGLGDIAVPTTSAEFQRPAPRPAWSVLGHDAAVRAGIAPIGDWRERWRVAAPVVLGDQR